MNILILSGDDMSFYKFRKELIIELHRKKHTCYLATRFCDYREKLAACGCETIDLAVLQRRGTSVFADIKLYHTYRKLIRDIRPDVILTYTLKPRVYGNFASGKTPIINTVTGMGSYTLDQAFVARLATFLDKWSMKHTNHVFFQNRESRDIYHARKLLSTRIPTTIVPASGVNLDDFRYLKPIPHEDVAFVFIGRIMKDKGVEEFFEAARRVKENPQNEPVSFHMYGFYEEDYRQKIEDYQAKGIIVYHGFVSDVRPELAKADCIILPSYHEGVGNAIQEAAASGRAVIASDIPGCNIVVDEGISGYYCQVRDANSLYKCIIKFLRLTPQQRIDMGIAGREKMKREHDRKDVIAKYIAVIEAFKS